MFIVVSRQLPELLPTLFPDCGVVAGVHTSSDVQPKAVVSAAEPFL